MRHVLVGLHLTTASARLRETLAALYEATPQPFGLVLLEDPVPGEEAGLASTLRGLDGVLRLAVPAPGGAPAALNCLLAQPGGVHVLLEDGVRPAWGWLAHLLDALDADPRHGLAGPGTDRCWNAQAQAAPGTGVQVLAPLQGPADFCLAVRGELAAAIGGADTAYGRGPCWELDYSVRAARAGFHGVWARGAQVLRGPLPAWRLAHEPALMQASRQRLDGAGRRDRLALPAPAALRMPAAPLPLVSCIMPTRGRPAFVARAIEYFRRQDYPSRELVIVHETDADLPDGVGGPDIRLVRTGERSIGGKRNEAVRAARGDIIAHWDDDDWYGVQRLSRQVLPIRQGVADITGLNDMLFMVTAGPQFWAVTRALFARLFQENVSGGTLVFRRALWERRGPYPATSLREDADFMAQALRGGARLCRLPGRDLCVYVRHARNTWKFAEGRYLQQGGWLRVPAPAFMAGDMDFYAALHSTARPVAQAALCPAGAPAVLRGAGPLVSCIMPTAQRRAFVPRAIRQFLSQDYAARELVVVDDGEDSIADLVPEAPGVRYLRLGARASVGEKRNIACEAARGELVAHWDDDDWMAPRWLGAQVGTLLAQDADLCGLDKVFFYAPQTRQAWRYVYDGQPPWVCGGTLCYTRERWRRAPFPHANVGEDNAFVWSAVPARMAVSAHSDLYVATVHPHNTSPKATAGRRWHAFPAAQLELLMRSASPALQALQPAGSSSSDQAAASPGWA